MSTTEYTSRLKNLSASNKDILAHIAKLSKIETDPAFPAQDQETRTELADEIHSNLKELESEFELFKQEVEDVVAPPGCAGQRKSSAEKEKDRLALVTQIARFGEDLKLARVQFRRAALQAKRSEEQAQRKAREALFASANLEEGNRPASSRRKGRDENKTQDELTLSAAGDVTAGLRRLHQHLNDSLGRSAYAKEVLETSTAALRELEETYTSVVEQGLKTARGLVGKLISSQKSDTWYLETALYIICATIAWLIFRRWLFGPLLYLVYKPSRFMLGIVYSALNLTLSVLTGTLFAGGQQDLAQPHTPSNTRPALIIKPSAAKRGNIKRQGTDRPNIKVGLGGGGPAEGRDPSERAAEAESLREEIARMSEQANNAETGRSEIEKMQQEQGAAGASVSNVRGDGTVLRERTGDEKPNPKKRMMEEPPPAQEGQAKDEL